MPEPEGSVPLDEVASRFARACRKAGVEHLFVGAFAVIAWGQPRTTSDLDALVHFEEEDVDRLASALEEEGLETSARDLRAGLQEGSHVSVFTPDPVLTVDISPVSEPHEIEEIREGIEIELDGGPVRVASAEDTIVFKARFGSPQDLQDAQTILARQGDDLDHDRLRALADQHGVTERVEELVEEVDARLDPGVD